MAAVEAYDGISCPCESGIFTHEPATSLDAIEATVSKVLQLGRIPVMLGGEHTVTVPAIRALAASGMEFGIVHFDAHADLRESYEGDPLSHACALHEAAQMNIPLLQIGVRSLSIPEVELRKQKGIHYLDGYEIGRNGIPAHLLPKDFPEKIYVTFDVDALDPSIMPATGTPEPGGLTWFQTFDCFEQILESKTVVGCDFVELAPIEKFHAPDFLVARMIYNFMGLISRKIPSAQT
jgi:agmatinase